MGDFKSATAVSVESGTNATGQIRRAIENLNILKLSFSQYISVMYDAYGCSATIQVSRIGQAVEEKYNTIISNLEEAKNKTTALEKNTYLEGRSFDFIYFSDVAACGIQAIAGIAAAIGGKIRIAGESIAGCSQKLDILLADMEEELGMLSQTRNVISGMSFMVTVENENACRTYMYSGSQDMSFASSAEQQFVRTASSKKSQAYDLVNTACQQLQSLMEKIRQMKENITKSVDGFMQCGENFRRYNLEPYWTLQQISEVSFTYQELVVKQQELEQLQQEYSALYGESNSIINKTLEEVSVKRQEAYFELQVQMDAASTQLGNPSGPCNMYAIANLVRRKQVLDGQEPFVTWQDIASINNASDYSARWTSNLRYISKETETASVSYYATYESRWSEEWSGGYEGRLNRMQALLQEHPEGIMIFLSNNGYSHGIVITDYRDGHFYVIDSWSNSAVSVAVAESRLLSETCTGYYMNITDENILNCMNNVYYLNN